MARLLAAGSEGEVYTAVLDQAQMEDEAGETMVCVKKPHLTGPEGLAAVFEVQQLPFTVLLLDSVCLCRKRPC